MCFGLFHAGVGPITFADSNSVDELLLFYNAVTALKAIPDSGGDIHEYALDAMLDALEFTVKEKEDEDYYKLLWSGTQMIVLTDAPSKNKDLKRNIIKMAENSICIHFFVSYHDLFEDGVYREIADKTDGTFVKPYSNWTLSTFIASYNKRPCGVLNEEPQKRAASMCKSFQVSQLASLFKFSGKSNNMVTVTSPSGKSIDVVSEGIVAIHSEPNPEPGEWQACAKSGMLEVSVAEDIQIDATIIYLNDSDSKGSTRTSKPPTECKFCF